MRILGRMILVAVLSSLTGSALAHDTQIVQGGSAQIVQGGSVQLAPQVLIDAPEERPSVFMHSLQGTLAGALVGTGIGYLTVYDGADGDPVDNVLMGSAVGALAGAGLGLGFGLLDLVDEQRSPVRYVTRDMLYGTALGGLFGTIAGSIVVIDGGDGDDVLAGAAIGGISGVVLGAIVGVIEGQWRKPSPTRRVTTTISVSQDERGKHLLLPSIAGRF